MLRLLPPPPAFVFTEDDNLVREMESATLWIDFDTYAPETEFRWPDQGDVLDSPAYLAWCERTGNKPVRRFTCDCC